MQQTLITIDPRRIAGDPDQPRTWMDPDELETLADSIESEGLQQPITIRQVVEWQDGLAGPETHQVVVGHRRLEAMHIVNARRAKRGEPPLLIDAVEKIGTVDADGNIERSDLLAQIIENSQREDIRPIDEARAYARALTFDLSQSDLARRVGRTVGHVSKRLKLLELPDVALDAINGGGLSIEDGLELVSITGVTPEIVTEAMKRDRDPVWAANQLTARAGKQAKVEAAIALAVEAGVPVERGVKSGYGFSVPEAAKGWAVISEYGGGRNGMKGLELKPEAHRKEPCRALFVSPAGYDGEADTVHEACTDPKRHTSKGESAVKPPAAARALQPAEKAKRQETIARNRARREASAARMEVLILHAKDRLPKTATAFVIQAFVDEILSDGTARAVHAKKAVVQLLALTVGKGWNAEASALRGFCKTEADTLRLGLLLLLFIQEESLSNGHGDKDGALVTILTGWGHELSAQEKIDLGIAKPKAVRTSKPKVPAVHEPEVDEILDDDVDDVEAEDDDDVRYEGGDPRYDGE